MTNIIQFPGLKPLGAPDETAPSPPPAGQRSAPIDPSNPLAGIGAVTGDRLIGPGNDDYGRAPLLMPEGDTTKEAMEAALQLLPPEVAKALSIIQRSATEGVSFVVIGIKPTKTGADFFTALHGDHGDLLAAKNELPAVIDRLYTRKGIR